MARRPKYNRRYAYEPPLELHPEAKRGILIIFLLALGALALLSFFNSAGEVGRIFDNALAVAFGSLRPVFGAALLIFAVLIFLKRNIKILTISGMILFFASLGGLVHLIAYHKTDLFLASQLGQGGGYVGLVLSFPLLKYTGFAGGALISFALFVISLVIIFNTSLHTIVKIINFIFITAVKIFQKLFTLFAAMKNKETPSFEKKEALKTDEIDSAENEKTFSETPEPFTPREQEKMVFPPKKRRQYIELPLSLLNKKSEKPTAGDINSRIANIAKTLANFGISVEMGAYSVGPTVTQYTLKPADGVKLSRITGLSNDLALALAAHPIRIEAPIPGKSLVGIEVPNQSVAVVYLRGILDSQEFRNRKTNLTFALGLDVAGRSWVADLVKMPHLLVAGSTGSGKSVALNSLIVSLLYSNGPDDLKLILVDPKRVEFPIYNGVPHLLTPVITDVKKTVNSLKWAIGEMERRFDLLSHANRRDIGSYNSAEREPLPYIIIVIDELADLMAAAGAEIEACIIRLAQMSRAVGIHLVVATQRPSVDVITGLIKANITSRMAFSVGSLVDSRTILDTSGAEKLLGRGDMLFTTNDLSKPKRLQGAYVGEDDVKKVVNHLKNTYGQPSYDQAIVEKQKIQLASGLTVEGDDADPLLSDAIETIISAGKASASLLQRRLSVGYARAARLLDILERQGMIGPAEGAKPREILMKKNDFTPAPRVGSFNEVGPQAQPSAAREFAVEEMEEDENIEE